MRGADAYGVVKTKTGACERRVIAPLTWAVELALLQVMSELAQPLQILPRLCAGLFLRYSFESAPSKVEVLREIEPASPSLLR